MTPASESSFLKWLPALTAAAALLVNVIWLSRWTQRQDSTNERQDEHIADLKESEKQAASTYVSRIEWQSSQSARNTELGDIKTLLRDQGAKIDALYNATIKRSNTNF